MSSAVFMVVSIGAEQHHFDILLMMMTGLIYVFQ
jgi:hypothetical protein